MTPPAEARSPMDKGDDRPIELDLLLYALPYPIFVLAPDNRIIFASAAAEAFFSLSIAVLKRQTLDELLAFGSPLFPLLDQVRRSGATVNEYGVEMHSPKFLMPKLVDVHAGPFPERPGHILLMIQQRNMAQMIERQRILALKKEHIQPADDREQVGQHSREAGRFVHAGSPMPFRCNSAAK